jgi:hypothetical protein
MAHEWGDSSDERDLEAGVRIFVPGRPGGRAGS